MINFVYNPGERKYLITEKSYYYVDKTKLIYHLNEIINTDDRFICVSRPIDVLGKQ